MQRFLFQASGADVFDLLDFKVQVNATWCFQALVMKVRVRENLGQR